MSSTSGKKGVVCVFCGSNPGASPAHMQAAKALGEALHANNLSLVYGGGTIGLMGQVARTLVSLAGPDSVHGVIPEALMSYEQSLPENEKNQKREQHETTYGRITVVKDMHERKALMARNVIEGGEGGGFVALSGGYGTIEEIAEITTWNQLGIHERPVVVFNVEGYYDGLMMQVKKAVEQGFVKPACSDIIAEATDSDGVVKAMRTYKVAEGRFNLDWEKR